jgi:O-antigen/teichoic acid export membrane protein
MSATIPQANENLSPSRGWPPAIATRILPRSNFARNVATVVSASAVAQGLLLLASPLITRLYTPEDFGVFTVFASLLSILTVPACGRFEQAIALPDDDREAVNILTMALGVLLVTCLLLSTGLWFFGAEIARITRIERLQHYLWLLPPSLIGTGILQAMTSWTIRTKSFGILGWTQLGQSLVQISAQVLFGFLFAGPAGLVVGAFIGRVGGAISLGWKATSLCHRPGFFSLWRLAKRYRRFPILSAPAALLSTLAQQMIPLIVITLFGPVVGGLFALIQRLLSAPTYLICTAVSQVYLAESARIGVNRTKQKALFWSVSRKLLLLGSPLLVLSLLDSSQLVSIIFGDKWTDAASYVRPVSLLCYAMLVVNATGPILDVVERQDLHLLRELLRILITFGAVAISLTFRLSPLAAVQVLCGGGMLHCVVYACISLWAIIRIPE